VLFVKYIEKTGWFRFDSGKLSIEGTITTTSII